MSLPKASLLTDNNSGSLCNEVCKRHNIVGADPLDFEPGGRYFDYFKRRSLVADSMQDSDASNDTESRPNSRGVADVDEAPSLKLIGDVANKNLTEETQYGDEDSRSSKESPEMADLEYGEK